MEALGARSLISDDCDAYVPPGGLAYESGRRKEHSSDCDWDGSDSDAFSDDSTGAVRAKRRKAASLGGVRKGGAGGTRVLHRWTAEEHARLEALVRQYGTERNWATIAEGIRGRSGKQCRERWLNHLRSGIIKGNWLADEEFHLAMCHMLVGNQWSQHCNRLRGRTENSIKNYWNATLRSKQANKRRCFLWAYIDKVRGSFDDDAVRHRAFADTVSTVYTQSNEWLPAWLRVRLDSGDLELPRMGEPLGRSWRKLLDRELAFLRDKDTHVSTTGIPYPNPASVGGAVGSAAAASGSPAAGHRRQAQQQPRRQSQQQQQQQYYTADVQQQQQQYYQGAMRMRQSDMPQLQSDPSIGLELITSSNLADAMMMGEGPFPRNGSFSAASAPSNTPGAANEDDPEGLCVDDLPDALLPDDAGRSGAGVACALATVPGLPRLIVGPPSQQAWMNAAAAAHAAASAAGRYPPASAMVGRQLAGTPPLSRDSSFCGSVGSSGATPKMGRLRLASNSPAPQSPLALQGGVFAAAPDTSAHDGGTAPAAPFAVVTAGGGVMRQYQPSHLASAAALGSDFSAGTALQMAPSAPGIGQMYGSPALSNEVPAAAPAGPYLSPVKIQQQQQAAMPATNSPKTPDKRPCSSPFGSPHAQSGGAFDDTRANLPPARAPGSAPPTLGAAPLGPSQPGLSRFAEPRRSNGTAAVKYLPPPTAQQRDALEESLGAAGTTAPPMQQQWQQRSEAAGEVLMPPPRLLMRQSVAGGEGQKRVETFGMEGNVDGEGMLMPGGVPGFPRASCCGSVGSDGDAGALGVTHGGGSVPGSGMVVQFSGTLGLISSGSLGNILRENSAMLLDGSLFPELIGGGMQGPGTGAAGAGAGSALGALIGRREPLMGCVLGGILGGARSMELAAALSSLVRGDSAQQEGTLDQVLSEDS